MSNCSMNDLMFYSNISISGNFWGENFPKKIITQIPLRMQQSIEVAQYLNYFIRSLRLSPTSFLNSDFILLTSLYPSRKVPTTSLILGPPKKNNTTKNKTPISGKPKPNNNIPMQLFLINITIYNISKKKIDTQLRVPII